MPAAALRTAYADESHEQVVADIRARRRRVRIPPSPYFQGNLRTFQHDGVSVMYLTPRMILGDVTGLGKTIQSLAYVCLLVDKGECTPERPALIVSEAKAFYDTWIKDGFETFTPNLSRFDSSGDIPPAFRRAAYARRATHVVHMNYPIFLRDYDKLIEAYPDGFATTIFDEASVIKSHETRTAARVKAIGAHSPRTILLTATPIQIGLLDLHSLLEALQLHSVVGTATAFDRRYYNYNVVERVIPGGSTVHVRERSRVQPYRHIDELRRIVWPYYYRRSYTDVAGEMPELSWVPEYVDLTTEQRLVYEAIRTRSLPEHGPGFRFKLNARAFALKKAAVSLQTVMHSAIDSSSKLDWLMQHVQGPWADDGSGKPVKVVVYSTFKDTVLTAARRCKEAGIGFVVFSGLGDLPDHDGSGPRPWPYGSRPRERSELRDRFFNDPDCRILFGTTAIEMGLNLQAAPVLVNLDSLSNPARMRQIAGRIWRLTSPFRFVQVYSLFARGTVEAGVLRLLQERQQLIDLMNGEESPEALFSSFSDADLERLVATDWATAPDPSLAFASPEMR